MRGHCTLGLILIILILFISNLSADIAKQKQLESQFRYETDFIGLITWWDDDTMKELDGYFSPRAEINTVDDVFQSIIKYTGLTNDDYYLWVDESYGKYVHNQKLNGKHVDGYGNVEINVEGRNVHIFVRTLIHVNAINETYMTKEDAYSLYTKNTVPAERKSIRKSKPTLLYIPDPPDYAYLSEKPSEMLLVWRLKGKKQIYYFDAITERLVYTRKI